MNVQVKNKRSFRSEQNVTQSLFRFCYVIGVLLGVNPWD